MPAALPDSASRRRRTRRKQGTSLLRILWYGNETNVYTSATMPRVVARVKRCSASYGCFPVSGRAPTPGSVRTAAERGLGRQTGATLDGSFSAVSKPNFASKYAFESSRRDLHINALLCTTLQSQFVVKHLQKYVFLIQQIS